MRLSLLLLLAGFPSLSATGLDDLQFLAGCWEGENSAEVWLKPGGGTMLGVGRTVRGGQTVESEFMHIATGPGGDVVMSIQLKLAQTVTAFKLTASGAGFATFENPGHDFPQRILYRAEKDGSLGARIEGTVGGKPRGRDYRFRPTGCR